MIKFNKLNFLLIIIFQGLLFSSSYNIYGEVLDFNTKNPIQNVNIYIKDQTVGTVTDNDGFFNLSLNDLSSNNINLIIKTIGYEDKEILIDLSNSRIDIGIVFLKNESIELKSVHVHSNKNSSKQISNIVIGGQELNESLKGNIATTLSNHPNIGINSFGIVTSKPALRGFSGDRFLLTKDGIETGDLSQSSIDHVITLDMGEVSEIEIIRGPKSLIYGPNAIGGVINTTIAGNPKTKVDKFSTKFIFGSESYNRNNFSLYNQGLYGNLLFYIPIKNNQLNLSINNRTTQNQTSPIGMLENTDSKTQNYKIGFTHYNNFDYMNCIIENYIMDYGIPPTTSGHTTGIDIPLLKKSLQINYHKDITFKNLITMDWKYNFIDYEHKEIIPGGQREYELLLAKNTHNLKIEFNSNHLLFGSEINIRKFKSDGINETPATNEVSLSFYGFHQSRIGNSEIDVLSSFRLGHFSVDPLYYNYNNPVTNLVLKDEEGDPVLDDEGNRISLVRDRNFNNISFSFGLKRKIDKFEVNSWIMHTMRSPRVEELYSDGPHLATYSFEIGNPNLKAEKIYGIENSIKYNSGRIDFSLATFYNYSPYYFQMTKDGNCEEAWDWDPNSGESHPCAGSVGWIDWGSAPLGWLYIYSPKGNEVVIKGAEINLGYKLKRIHLNYNFSFVHGDNKTLNMPLSYMNPMKQVFDLSYNNKSFLNYKIRISKIHPQDRLGEFETYTPGALLTDFIFSYNHGKHNITLQFNNIFDEIYYNHLSRIKAIMPEPGTNIHFVYKVLI